MSSYYDEPDQRPVCVECGDRLREGTHVASGGIVYDVYYACSGCGVRWHLIRESVERPGVGEKLDDPAEVLPPNDRRWWELGGGRP